MSHSASIYRITKETFETLRNNPNSFKPYISCLDYEVFNATHEGLQYVFTRNQPEKTKSLLSEVFYPASSIIGRVDTTGYSIENFEEIDMEEFEEVNPYLTPEEVTQIHAVLKTMDEAYFKANFNPQEMNQAGIYPRFWGEGIFDYTNTYEDFQNLKMLFQKAATEGNYLLSYVG